MTRPYSLAFKQKMVQRLTGKNAVSALQLSKETGVQQQSLSRWLQEARSLPLMASKQRVVRRWNVEQKARLLTEASKLDGEQLSAYLEQEGVKIAELERWRSALEDDGRAPTAIAKHMRKLERELARKEKALAEAAALLVLKKRWAVSTTTGTAIPTRRTRSDPGRDRRSAVLRRTFGTSLSSCRRLPSYGGTLAGSTWRRRSPVRTPSPAT
jgi:transposase-like protein